MKWLFFRRLFEDDIKSLNLMRRTLREGVWFIYDMAYHDLFELFAL